MTNDEKLKSMLYSLVSSLETENLDTLKTLTEGSKESPLIVPFILECGLIRHIPIHLLTNLNQTIKMLEAVYSTEEEIKVDEFFFDRKNIFFFVDKIYQNINNHVSILIIKLIIKLFKKMKHKEQVLFLNILYENGFFILLNCIFDEVITEFYDTIFENKTRTAFDSDITHFTDSKTLIEVKRKQFDNEVLFRNKVLMKYRAYKKVTINVNDDIFNKIVESIDMSFNKCKDSADNSFRNMENSDSYISNNYTEHKADGSIVNDINPIHLFNFTNFAPLTPTFINKILSLDVTDFHFLRAYFNLFTTIENDKNKIFHFNKNYDSDLLKSIYTHRKNTHYSSVAINLIHLINNMHKEINLDSIEIIKNGNQDDANHLISILETGNLLVLYLIKEMKFEYFLKPSFLILLQGIKYKVNDSHSKEISEIIRLFQRRIVAHLKKNPYNFALMLFNKKVDKKSSKEKKGKKRAVDAKNSTENSSEINEESSNETNVENSINVNTETSIIDLKKRRKRKMNDLESEDDEDITFE